MGVEGIDTLVGARLPCLKVGRRRTFADLLAVGGQAPRGNGVGGQSVEVVEVNGSDRGNGCQKEGGDE